MTQQQKQEKRINNLLKLIIESTKNELSEDHKRMINTAGFLYSVNQLNDLQAAARLTQIALKNNININDILDALEGN